MESVQLTTKAKFKPGGKGVGVDGVLMMTAKSFTWVPNDPRKAVKLEVELSNIKSHRWSKETPNATAALLKFGTTPDPAAEGGYMFVFSSFPDRDKCRDIYGSFQAKYQAGGLKPPSSTVPSGGLAPSAAGRSMPGGIERLDQAMLQKRFQILQGDAKLRKLHEDLVLNGALTEAEFWAARKDLLEEEGRRIKQRPGIASAMLADLRGVADGSSNKVTFNLNPAIIHQIFAEKPAVHKAFLDCVPHKMTEKEFWTKYCKAEFVFRTRSASVAAAEAQDDDDLAMFVAPDNALLDNARRKIQKVDPTLDMAADDADDYSHVAGHGIVRDDNREARAEAPLGDNAPAAPRQRSIFQDLNRHAEVVLEGRYLDEDIKDARAVAMALAAREHDADRRDVEEGPEAEKRRKQRAEKMTEMEDLETLPPPNLVPLQIQDPRKYFDSQSTAGNGSIEACADMDTEPTEAASNLFNRRISSFRQCQVADPVLVPDVARQVLIEFASHAAASKQMEGPAAEKKFLEALPESLQSAIFGHAMAVKELLKHFWATYPITTPSLLAKAQRHKEGVGQLYDRLEKTKAGTTGEHRHLASQLLQPLFQALDAALAHYESEEKKRTARPAGRTIAKPAPVN